MRLTNNEVRDVIKYLEAGKTLPDKYRFMLFDDVREVELLWNGKTNEVTSTVLPFQTIEVVDEPRSENIAKIQQDLFSTGGRQISGWTNKLIWGDNKLILSSLKNGPLRQEIEDQGGIKLIYIDPPFDVGADFSMDIEIGEESLVKRASVLEELAYRDTWGRGADSFISMIYERLRLMRDLLADDGSIYVHCDDRLSGYLRIVMDEVFGKDNFRNHIIWKRTSSHNDSKKIGKVSDSIFYYSKTDNAIWNPQFRQYDQEYLDSFYRHTEDDGRKYRLHQIERNPALGMRENLKYEYNGYLPRYGWMVEKQKLELMDQKGMLVWTRTGKPQRKIYLDENSEGQPIHDIWDDVSAVGSQSKEKTDYPTQKPEALLERIIKTSTNDGDLVADLFMGSGTAMSVAEKLSRKWIGSDMGKFSIHTARKRMINLQRQLKNENKNYRAFEILNLGRYERQHYVGVNTNLRAEEQEAQLTQKENDFVALITKAYKASPEPSFKNFQAIRNNRLVAIGPINLPVSRQFFNEAINEAIQLGFSKVDILAFEFEMGLSPAAQDDARSKGVDVMLKYIPREVFDKRAIEKDQVVFHDVSYIEVKPHIKGKTLSIELTDFSVFYSQASIDQVSAELKPGGSKVEVIDGQIWKIWKAKDTDIIEREQLTKHWTDWIDYWSVDFNYESKKELIYKQDELTESTDLSYLIGEDEDIVKQEAKLQKGPTYTQIWTGDYIFENDWQSFRTKKDRKLELQTVFSEYPAIGRYKVAIKVIDIFGNDTTKVIDVGM
jgi:DNA modification methylase